MLDVVYEFDSQAKELESYKELVEFQRNKIKRLIKANRTLSNELAEEKKIAKKSLAKPKVKKTKS